MMVMETMHTQTCETHSEKAKASASARHSSVFAETRHKPTTLTKKSSQSNNGFLQRLAKDQFIGVSGELPKSDTKAMIGQSGDTYEQEADRVALDIVSRLNEPQTGKVQGIGISKEKNEILTRLPFRPLALPQQSTKEKNEIIPPHLLSTIHRACMGGQNLQDSVREPMERAFGCEFKGVKIHNDFISNRLNQSLHARAFTFNKHIFFNRGQFRPDSEKGQCLLAHELTHVTQKLPFLARCSECEDLARRLERDDERAARALPRHSLGSGFLLGDRYYIRFFGSFDQSWLSHTRFVLSQWIRRRYSEFSDSARFRGMAVASQVFLGVVWPNEDTWIPARLIDLGEDDERVYGFLWCTTEELASITRAVEREQRREAEREAPTTEEQVTLGTEQTSETSDIEETQVLEQEPLGREGVIEVSQSSESEGDTGTVGRRSVFVARFELEAIRVARRILNQAEDILLNEQRRYRGFNTVAISSYSQQRLQETGARPALEAVQEAARERTNLIEDIQRFVQQQERMEVERAELTQTHVLSVQSQQAISELRARSLQSREQLEQTYPIVAGLSMQQLQSFSQADDVLLEIRDRLDVERRLENIRRLREGLEPGGQYSVWLYPRLVNLTKVRMGVQRNSVEEYWITQEVRTAQTVRDVTDFMLATLGIAFSLVSVAATGGVAGVAFAASAAAFAVGTVSLYRDIERYLEEQSAATFALDPRQALSNVEPSAVWLGLSILGLGFDVFDIASSVNRLSQMMARSLSNVATTLPNGREQVLGNLVRSAAEEWRISPDVRGQFRNADEFVGTVVSAGRRRLTEIEQELSEISPIRVRASSETGYLCEVPVESGHVWRMRPNGRWCRFSNPEFCSLLEVMLEEADYRRLLTQQQPQRNRRLLEEILEEESFRGQYPGITGALEETALRGPAPRRARIRRPPRGREPGSPRYREQSPIPRRWRVIPRPIDPTVTSSRVMGRQVRSDYLSHGFYPSGPQNAIRPDITRPTVELRQNGDILGSYDELLAWLRNAQLSYRVQAHHIFENHFAEMFGISRQKGRSIALLQEEHSQFTAEMGRIIQRGTMRLDIDSIYEAHVQMYRNLGHPEWIDELRMSIRQHRDQIRHAYESGTVPSANLPDFNDRRTRAIEFLESL